MATENMHSGFHPSKEGFKVMQAAPERRRAMGFHPSKEGFKAGRLRWRRGGCPGFHPSKEGFKEECFGKGQTPVGSFHPSKEGFKEGNPPRRVGVLRVSIPLRKVSRSYAGMLRQNKS